MATRDDITVFWHLDPRLVFVDAPSTEVSVQDLHDTLREIEQRPDNMIYPSIVDSAGKEDLGGGVSVGVTTTLQNARIGFQARKEFVTSGLISSPDTNGELLIDSGTTFSGVIPGAWVVNLEDGSVATVLNIDSTTQLRTDFLGGGSDNQFNTNDRYKILNVTQVEVAGGNLVAVDEFTTTIDPIFPTAGTQAVRASASSATTQSQAQLEHSTFNGGVTVDVINGTPGTDFPYGTQRDPVSNIPDAVQIADTRGFKRLNIIGDITLDTGDNVEGLTLVGESPSRTLITVNAGALTENVQLEDATVTGEFDTAAGFTSCHTVNIQFVKADLHDCLLEGTITLSGTGQTRLINCQDGLVNDAPPPSVDFNGSGRSLSVRNYHGDLELKNKSGPEGVEVNINSGGRLKLDSTVTAGTIRLTGIIEVDDQSSGSAVVDIAEVIFPDQLQLAAFNNQIYFNPIVGISGVKFPQGTLQYPIDNITDVLTVAGIRGIDRILCNGTVIIQSGEDISGLTLVGESPVSAVVVLESGCITNRTNFENMILNGEVNGPIVGERIALQEVTGIGSDEFPTIFDRCIFRPGVNKLMTTASGQNIHFVDCFSGVPGPDPSSLDINNSSSPIAFRNYRGGMGISNYTAGQQSTFGLMGGRLYFDSTCTSGVAVLDGNQFLESDAGPNFEIRQRSNFNTDTMVSGVWNTPVTTQTDTSTMGGWIANKVLTLAKFLGVK